MAEIKIKSEKPNKRCEICHQTDCFDPEKNFCKRCNFGSQDNYVDLQPEVIKISYWDDLRYKTKNFINDLTRALYRKRVQGWILSFSPVVILAINGLLFANGKNYQPEVFKLFTAFAILINVFAAIFLLRNGQLSSVQRITMFLTCWITFFISSFNLYQDLFDSFLASIIFWVGIWTCCALLFPDRRSKTW